MSKSLKILLIVVGVLVALGALIAFVGWPYLKKVTKKSSPEQKPLLINSLGWIWRCFTAGPPKRDVISSPKTGWYLTVKYGARERTRLLLLRRRPILISREKSCPPVSIRCGLFRERVPGKLSLIKKCTAGALAGARKLPLTGNMMLSLLWYQV